MANLSVEPADLQLAAAWLTRHGLVEAQPTPLLATRLAVRRRARTLGSLLLAALFIGAALIQAYNMISTAASGESETRWLPLLAMTALMLGVLVARWLLDSWVRRIDRRAGATLARRAAHAVQPGWRTVLSPPYAVFAVATLVAALVLAVGALTVPDSTLRYAALVVLIGLIGVAVGDALHLRHLLTRPVVADDEASLTADVIMRVEDARELVVPSAQWTLPAVLLVGTELGWWNAVSIGLVIVGVVTLAMIHARTPSIATVARHAVTTR